MKNYFESFVVVLFMGLIFISSPVFSQETEEGYLFSADRVAYDEAYGLVVAVGNVEIISQGETVRADEAILYEKEERIEAKGNVSLTDKDGNVFFTESISFTDEGNNIFALGIKGLLKDNSRLTGANGKKTGNRIVMNKALYSPCEICPDNVESELPWQLKASKITHDADKNTIVYRNARLEMWGVPVLWTPYFSHPDPTVVQKSGFLRPSYGFRSQLGTVVGSGYYWGINENRDATINLRATSKQGLVGDLEYRERFEHGDLYLRGSITKSDRIDNVSGFEVIDEDKTRGHLEGKLNYHINENWRAGFDFFRSSDDQYARLYDYSAERIFESRVFAERFDQRDFTSFELLSFQDVRLNIDADQPEILPLIEHDIYGAPGSFFGGRLHANASFLGLTRGDGQDLSRLGLSGDWSRRVTSDYGFLTDITASLDTDLFYTTDRRVAELDPTRSSDSTAFRAYPQIHAITRYPFANYVGGNTFILEPIVSVSYGTRIENDENDIPNEDSQDLLLDWTNLFQRNRFPGRDRVEDGTRVTYGLNTALHRADGSQFEVFLGQSYRLTDDDIFPTGSGLEEDFSDVVAGAQFTIGKYYTIDYSTLINDDNFVVRRHEFSSTANLGRFNGRLSYFFNRAVDGTGIEENREQIQPIFSYMLDKNWTVGGRVLYDLTADQNGLVRAGGNIQYALDCFTLNLGLNRNLINRASGESELEFLFTIGLKNLGEI